MPQQSLRIRGKEFRVTERGVRAWSGPDDLRHAQHRGEDRRTETPACGSRAAGCEASTRREVSSDG